MSDYENFIESIKSSRENVWFKYSERHHIIPRCLGGTDEEDNLIYLTLREHFIAHVLLHEEYPDNRDLAYALTRMCDGRREITAEEYEYARKACIGKMSSDEVRFKISIALKKYVKSEDHCRHISEGKKGKKTGDDNIMRSSEEARRKVSLAFKGSNNPMYGKVGESHPLYGSKYYWYNDGVHNHRVNISEDSILEAESKGWVRGKIQKEVIYDEELRKKMGDSHRGYHHTEESIEKIRSKVVGQKRTEAQKERMRISHRDSIYHMTCRNCKCEFISKVPGRKYCDKCKGVV